MTGMYVFTWQGIRFSADPSRLNLITPSGLPKAKKAWAATGAVTVEIDGVIGQVVNASACCKDPRGTPQLRVKWPNGGVSWVDISSLCRVGASTHMKKREAPPVVCQADNRGGYADER